MKRVALGLAMVLALGSAGAQQVWRCEQDGQVRYTDQPCEKDGRPLPAPAAAASDAPAAAEPPASAASPALQQATPPENRRRAPRSARAPQFAMNGLMHTDFVQRGYVPRRQNPPSPPISQP